MDGLDSFRVGTIIMATVALRIIIIKWRQYLQDNRAVAVVVVSRNTGSQAYSSSATCYAAHVHVDTVEIASELESCHVNPNPLQRMQV